MFRDVARTKQKLPPEECIELLKIEKRGVLSLIGDDGYPYSLPINHYYCDDDGRLFFTAEEKDIRSTLSETVTKLPSAFATAAEKTTANGR